MALGVANDNARIVARVVMISALVIAPCLAILAIPRSARATTTYAAQTGQPCAACHTQPDGGPGLTDFGKAFQANGYKLPG